MSYGYTDARDSYYRNDEIRDFYNQVLRESTRPRRTRKRMTVAEIRRDTFNQICKKLLPRERVFK